MRSHTLPSKWLTSVAAGAAVCSALLVSACSGGSPPGHHAVTPTVPPTGGAASTEPVAVAGPGTAGGPAGDLPRCHTGQLAAAFTGLNAASGGGRGMTLILTNDSSRSCYLYGHVGLGLLGGHLTWPGPLATHVTWVSAPHQPVR